MTRTLFAGAAALTIAAAAGMSATAAPADDWAGFYAGVHGGYGGDKFDHPLTGDVTDGTDNAVLGGSADITSSGFLGGAQLGYNHAIAPNWVFGVEADIALTDIEGKADITGTSVGDFPATATVNAGTDIDYLATARLRLGYATERLLIYATGGVAHGEVDTTFDIDAVVGSTTWADLSNSMSGSRTGWTLGGGVEYAVNDRVSLKTEYVYTDLGSDTLLNTPFSVSPSFFSPTYSGNIRLDSDAAFHAVRFGVNFKLN